MIRRLRAAAPAILALGITAVAALTVLAQAVRQPEYPTVGEMHRFVVWMFLSGSGVVILGLTGVYVWDQRGRNKQIDDLTKAVRTHHEDWVLHPTGSTHRIDEFDKKLGEVHVMLGGIQAATMTLVEGQKRTQHDVEEHDGRLRAAEAGLATLNGRLAAGRDPMDSPDKRRRVPMNRPDDSGDDWRAQRGKE